MTFLEALFVVAVFGICLVISIELTKLIPTKWKPSLYWTSVLLVALGMTIVAFSLAHLCLEARYWSHK